MMSTRVEKRIIVEVPVTAAYNQWARFEEFPHFMQGVDTVTRLTGNRIKWAAHVAGAHRQWEAIILEQIQDRKISWTSTEGAKNSGTIAFRALGADSTELALTLEYQPKGAVERMGDMLHIVGRQAEHDLKKFKEFIEHENHAKGAWRATHSNTWAGPGTGTAAEQPLYNRFAHPFDQTNGMVDFEGESDETLEGENYSSAERRNRHHEVGYIPPFTGSF